MDPAGEGILGSFKGFKCFRTRVLDLDFSTFTVIIIRFQYVSGHSISNAGLKTVSQSVDLCFAQTEINRGNIQE